MPSRVIQAVKRCYPALLVVLAVAGTSPAGAGTVVDATGRAVAVKDASRIVSIGGAVTEILYALGLEKRIAAVDTTSVYPLRAMKEKPNVGYMRQLSAEGVLGIAPTLILAVDTAGPKQTLDILQQANIPLVIVPDTFTGDGIVEKIRIVAEAVGVPSRGQCLIDQVRRDLDALARISARIGEKQRVLFTLSFVNGRAMVGGRHTAADGVIRLAGGINAITEYEGYKPVSDEALVAAKPDVILSMTRSGPLQLTAEDVFKHPGFAATPAAVHRAFVSMDGLYLLGFGPRTARAAHDLMESLYPDIKDALLPSERAPLEPCSE